MNFKIKNKADVSLTGNLNHFIEDLVKKIGITKPTLYARISKHNWKVSEVFLIEKLK